jgi:hypothetical protein
MVHDPVEAVRRLRLLNVRTVLALACCVGLLAGCGAASKATEHPPSPGVGSVRQADCTDWKKGTAEQRHGMVARLRHFAGGPVGSSAGIQNGPVLEDGRAYKVLQSYCSRYFARGFKLYKLYDRAAAFVGYARAAQSVSGL